MESVLELKEKLQNVYAQYSTYIDKAVALYWRLWRSL